MAEKAGLKLSFSQIAAGALATVTATVIASFFGVYGTIGGAAASSVISTAGTAIYQRFFRRTEDKLKQAGQHMTGMGIQPTRMSGKSSVSRQGMPSVGMATPPGGAPDEAGNADTAASHDPGQKGPGQATGAAERRTSARDTGNDGTAVAQGSETTNLAGTDDAKTLSASAMTGMADVNRNGHDRPTLGVILAWAREHWLVLLGAAAAVFVVVMGAVTITEAIMHKPLSSAVRGSSGSGFSLSGGGSGGNKPAPSPVGTPISTTRPSQSPSATPSQRATAGPTRTPGRVTRTPGQSSSQQPTTHPSSAPSPRSTSNGRGGATLQGHA